MDIPIYKGHFMAFERARDKKKYYRNSSSGFAKKARVFIIERDGFCCLKCGSDDRIQIDHIKSSYLGFINNIGLSEINNVDNLQVLCGKCNAGKLPEDTTDYRS